MHQSVLQKKIDPLCIRVFKKDTDKPMILLCREFNSASGMIVCDLFEETKLKSISIKQTKVSQEKFY